MASRTATNTAPPIHTSRGSLTTWTGLLNGDDGAAVDPSLWARASLQVTGTFGTGGTVSLEGSNDGGTTWVVLKDAAGAAITLTAAGLVVLQSTAFRAVRPRVTAGDGTTNLVARLYAAGLE
ncbi:hypothetical protein [Rubrivivax gelatinosus]|uniref:Uncharacterized protein n=1 Tax=Rubrivivax gelatinosus TaxID=28068 RepID=A0ABS1DYB0_RUBGE|nr:hypothetical protein [Rubrivivax gelatinosus]MBK1714640.1 hypothetical protein [Rubrivivax gelatinosus]